VDGLGRLRHALASARVAWSQRSAREWSEAIVPWILAVAGVGLILWAALPEVGIADTFRLTGEVGPGLTLWTDVNRSGFSYSEARFETPPSCDLRVYVLDPEQSVRFDESGALPDFSEALTCERRTGAFGGAVARVVFHNPSNLAIPYDVRVDLVQVSQPLGVLALPGFAIFISGAVFLIARMIVRGLTRMVDEFAERDEFQPPPKQEGKG